MYYWLLVSILALLGCEPLWRSATSAPGSLCTPEMYLCLSRREKCPGIPEIAFAEALRYCGSPPDLASPSPDLPSSVPDMAIPPCFLCSNGTLDKSQAVAEARHDIGTGLCGSALNYKNMRLNEITEAANQAATASGD